MCIRDSYIRVSNVDLFSSIIQEKKFIDTVQNLTIFVEKKNNDGELKNIFLKEKIGLNESQTIIAKEGKYTFISTGMSTIKDIENAVKIFRKHKCEFELMHSHSCYPMPVKEANLRVIQTLKKKFRCRVGYSGHEAASYVVSLVAVLLGASSIERHITLDRSMYGSDQAASLEPRGLKELCNSIKKITIAMGNSKIGHVTKEENEIAKKLRAHLKK